METTVSRRKLIAGALSLLAVTALAGRRLAEAALAKSKRLIRHFSSPLLLETPLEDLGRSWLTPNNLFFVLSRADMNFNQAERESWQIAVNGKINRTTRFSLAEIRRKFERVELPAYLQCAGNGRKFFEPKIEGLRWGYGAIGNALWGGVRLRDVLGAAGIGPEVKHIAFVGKDALPDRPDSYIKSIPIEKALNPYTILALTMNNELLPDIHGGPVRVLVPGWGGTYSVKWLTHVIALENPWSGFWMNQAYRIGGEPFTEFSVNSVITQPHDGEALPLDQILLEGLAWTGEAEIVGVDVSLDGGKTWQEAELGNERAKYAWRKWLFVWRPNQPGSYTLLARARDSRGRIQPLKQDNWNSGGYGWNAVNAIRVTVTWRINQQPKKEE